jgi:PAS domain S-box-containing protein
MFWPDGTDLPLDQCPKAVAIKEGRSLRKIEAVVERPDGSRRHVLAHPHLVYDDKGALIGATNVLVDITDRKESEEQLAALRTSWRPTSRI